MNPQEKQTLERVLESAIIVSWTELIRKAPSGLIHIEYDFASTGTLDRLQIWSCISRGHWLLACEYWMSPSTLHGSGIGFKNGYHSESLAHVLECVMQHQTAFSLPADLGRQGLLQIPTPSEEENRLAAASLGEAQRSLSNVVAANP